MRILAALALVAVACGGDDVLPAADAAPPRTWSVVWTCSARCDQAPPPEVTAATWLDIRDGDIVFHDDLRDFVHRVESFDSGCRVIAGDVETGGIRHGYRLCPLPENDDALRAGMAWSVDIQPPPMTTVISWFMDATLRVDQ